MVPPTDNQNRPPDGSQAPDLEDQSQLLPGWSSLVILLTLFGVISAVTVYAIVLREDDIHVTPDAGGLQAFAPEDFPEMDFNPPLLDSVVEATATNQAGIYNVPPAPFATDGIFPCSSCHADMESNTERRELMFHDEVELNHGPEERWCFDCHNAADRDHLRLVNGTLVGFEESYKLCGQCHGTIFRDWREGIHGRRQGYWDGAKSYLLCAHCHNPHAPAFQAMEPLPPPVRPSRLANGSEQTESQEGHQP